MLQAVLGDDFVRLCHYGSRVEGGAEPDSDYDVLCVTKRALSQQQRAESRFIRQVNKVWTAKTLGGLHQKTPCPFPGGAGSVAFQTPSPVLSPKKKWNRRCAGCDLTT
jgi:hypothetical protein